MQCFLLGMAVDECIGQISGYMQGSTTRAPLRGESTRVHEHPSLQSDTSSVPLSGCAVDPIHVCVFVYIHIYVSAGVVCMKPLSNRHRHRDAIKSAPDGYMNSAIVISVLRVSRLYASRLNRLRLVHRRFGPCPYPAQPATGTL